MTESPFEPKTVEFKIDDITYTIKEILVTKRNILLFKISQLAGAAAGGIGSLGDDVDYGEMLRGILYKYDPVEAAAFIKEIILLGLKYPDFEKIGHQTSADQAYEMHFTEYYEHQIPVIKAIWEQNFGKQIADLKKKLSTSKLATLARLILGEIQQKPQQETTESPDSPDKNQ